jgi:hypothetical protein
MHSDIIPLVAWSAVDWVRCGVHWLGCMECGVPRALHSMQPAPRSLHLTQCTHPLHAPSPTQQSQRECGSAMSGWWTSARTRTMGGVFIPQGGFEVLSGRLCFCFEGLALQLRGTTPFNSGERECSGNRAIPFATMFVCLGCVCVWMCLCAMCAGVCKCVTV